MFYLEKIITEVFRITKEFDMIALKVLKHDIGYTYFYLSNNVYKQTAW